MDLEFIVASPEEIIEIKQKCLQALESVCWRNDIQYESNTTLTNAIHYGRQGHDAGREQALHLQPTTNLFHDWMDYAAYCTVLYNRDNDIPKYTILRKVT